MKNLTIKTNFFKYQNDFCKVYNKYSEIYIFNEVEMKNNKLLIDYKITSVDYTSLIAQGFPPNKLIILNERN